MKKFTKITLFLMFMFIFPAIIFACGEVSFDDIPYLASSSSTQSIITRVDETRNRMINSIQLKVKLKTTNTYKYLENSTQQAKEVKDEIITTLGKTSDNPSVAQIEKTRYVDNVKTWYELKTYSHTTLQNGQENSFLYTFFQTYDNEGNVVSSTFNRSTYNQTINNFVSMYNEAVPMINSSFVDSTFEKAYEGTNYYKLSSDVVGLENVKNNFNIKSGLYENPELFSKNSLLDYVKPFTCEFGLKTTDGYEYITYSTLSYKIENSFRETYLNVTSKTTLEKYGDVVEANVPQNIDEYTVHTFVGVMNQANYLTYKTSDQASYSQVTVAEFGNDLSVEVKDFEPGLSEVKTNYFYKYDQENQTYICYKLNLSNQTYEEANYDLAILNFDFSKQYNGKVEENYQFGAQGAYINIQVANGEVSKVNTRVSGTDINLFVVDYGTDIAKLGLTSSLQNFTPAASN